MELRKTKQRLHVLELLAKEKVSHGYEIATQAELQVGTVYGILMSFEERGYVEGRWEELTTDGKPRRKLYRLTQQGIELLKQYQDHFGVEQKLGFFGAAAHELHTAIDQVWGGIFAISVRRERERQAEAARQVKR